MNIVTHKSTGDNRVLYLIGAQYAIDGAVRKLRIARAQHNPTSGEFKMFTRNIERLQRDFEHNRAELAQLRAVD